MQSSGMWIRAIQNEKSGCHEMQDKKNMYKYAGASAGFLDKNCAYIWFYLECGRIMPYIGDKRLPCYLKWQLFFVF